MPGRSLRILFVGTLPPHRGGSGVFSGQVLAELARRGHAIEAIAPISDDALASGERFARSHPKLAVTRFLVPYMVTTPDLPPSAEYRQREGEVIGELLAQSLARETPDVVIAGRESFVPHLEGIRQLPRALVIHGATMFGIARGTYSRELAEPLLEMMRGFDLILTPAHHSSRYMAKLGVPGVEVIPNPVDIDRFRPLEPSAALRRKLEADENDVVVLHASKLSDQKRPIDILDAAEIALAQEDRLLFVIAGDGRDREHVEGECDVRGLRRRFRFPGWIEHERMPELFSVADMVVMPSAYECQALVYLEAMACARPLIASDIPAAREVVEDGRNGILHPQGDCHALAAEIIACAHDPGLRQMLTAQGLVTARQHSLSRIADAYERALIELVVRRSGIKPSSA